MGLTLSEYITRMTPAKFCRLMNVTEHTAYNWKNKKAIPSAATAYDIIQVSNGLLTWESIFQPFFDDKDESQLNLFPDEPRV